MTELQISKSKLQQWFTHMSTDGPSSTTATGSALDQSRNTFVQNAAAPKPASLPRQHPKLSHLTKPIPHDLYLPNGLGSSKPQMILQHLSKSEIDARSHAAVRFKCRSDDFDFPAIFSHDITLYISMEAGPRQLTALLRGVCYSQYIGTYGPVAEALRKQNDDLHMVASLKLGKGKDEYVHKDAVGRCRWEKISDLFHDNASSLTLSVDVLVRRVSTLGDQLNTAMADLNLEVEEQETFEGREHFCIGQGPVRPWLPPDAACWPSLQQATLVAMSGPLNHKRFSSSAALSLQVNNTPIGDRFAASSERFVDRRMAQMTTNRINRLGRAQQKSDPKVPQLPPLSWRAYTRKLGAEAIQGGEIHLALRFVNHMQEALGMVCLPQDVLLKVQLSCTADQLRSALTAQLRRGGHFHPGAQIYAAEESDMHTFHQARHDSRCPSESKWVTDSGSDGEASIDTPQTSDGGHMEESCGWWQCPQMLFSGNEKKWEMDLWVMPQGKKMEKMHLFHKFPKNLKMFLDPKMVAEGNWQLYVEAHVRA